MKRMKAKVFIQDPFNPVPLTEDSEKYVNVCNIVCVLTSYNYSEDILEFEEGDVILPPDVLQHIYQWSRHYCRGSWDSWDDRNYRRWSTAWVDSKQKKGRFESGFFNYQAWQIWETMPANSFGDQWNSVKVFWIKGIKGTIGFIKGGAHLRHFWRIWFHSIVGCPWRGREKYNGSWGKQMDTKRFSFVLWKRRFLTMFCHAGPSSLVSKAWSNL